MAYNRYPQTSLMRIDGAYVCSLDYISADTITGWALDDITLVRRSPCIYTTTSTSWIAARRVYRGQTLFISEWGRTALHFNTYYIETHAGPPGEKLFTGDGIRYPGNATSTQVAFSRTPVFFRIWAESEYGLLSQFSNIISPAIIP